MNDRFPERGQGTTRGLPPPPSPLSTAPPLPSALPAAPPPTPALVPSRPRAWRALLAVLAGILILAGGAGLAVAYIADRSNQETFAREIESLKGGKAPDAATVSTARGEVRAAMERFWETSQSAVRAQRKLSNLFDRVVRRSDGGDRAGAENLLRKVEPLLRRYRAAVAEQERARRTLALSVRELEEVLR